MRDNAALEIVLSAVNSVYGAAYTLEDVYNGTRYRPLVMARQVYWYKAHLFQNLYASLFRR